MVSCPSIEVLGSLAYLPYLSLMPGLAGCESKYWYGIRNGDVAQVSYHVVYGVRSTSLPFRPQTLKSKTERVMIGRDGKLRSGVFLGRSRTVPGQAGNHFINQRYLYGVRSTL